MKFILLTFFLGTAMAGNLGYAPAPLIASVHHKTVPIARPVAIQQTVPVVKTHAHTVVDAVHHPPVSHLTQGPATVLAKAPRRHGFRYGLEVQHNAPAAVAGVGLGVAHSGVAVAAGPAIVGHGAGIVGHGVGIGGIVGGGIGYGAGIGAGYGHGGGIVGVKNIVGHAPAAITPAGAGPVVTRTAGYVGKSGGHSGYSSAPAIALPIGGGYGAGYGAGVIGHAGILGGYGAGIGAGYGHGHGVAVQKVGLAAGPAHVREPLRVSSYGIETGRVLQDSQTTYGTAHIPAVQKIVVKSPDVVSHHPARVIGHKSHVIGHNAHVVGHRAQVIGKSITPIGYAHGGYGHGY